MEMQPPAQEGSATGLGFQSQSKCCDIVFPLQCHNMMTVAAPLQHQHCWESRDEEGRQLASSTISTSCQHKMGAGRVSSCPKGAANSFLATPVSSSLSCYEYRAVPRKLSRFAAAQPRHLARGCARGTSFCNAISENGLRVQRGSTDGAGPGISSGEQQPPAGKIAMEELSQASASSFQKNPKQTHRES